eukprot:gnl/MRDRNA2_/MRDRNA2_83739_c0_seq2.p1 gnl/MRDRNA2_/MRDRNA2_83739_c0~~gnl/MRDRNA2_/MRDRNA2_83739_c0_seq2.p1  ORF type:complete len:622 (-),score=121.10 gnl/MRDRNA2_/MRDRNA2_83739_c0_seq2:114-1979(-)
MMAPGELNANNMLQLDFFIARLMELNGDGVARSLDFLNVRTDLSRVQEGLRSSTDELCQSLIVLQQALHNSPGMIANDDEVYKDNKEKIAKLLWKADLHAPEFGINLDSPPPSHGKATPVLTVTMSAFGKTHGENEDDSELDRQIESLFGRFDLFFGVFLIVNCLLLGIQVDDPLAETTNKLTWQIIDNGFLFVFTVELLFRVLLVHQVQEESDFRLIFYIVPSTMGSKSFTENAKVLARSLPKFLRDPLGVFDFTIVCISLLDNVIISHLEGGLNTGTLMVLRFVRLLKVARVTRSLRVCSELYLLVQSVVASLRALAWTVMLLSVFTMIVAIVLTESVGNVHREGRSEDDLFFVHHFGSVGGSMFTLTQVATLDGWADLVWRLRTEHPDQMLVLFFFIMIATFGIMNIIVGVMCESAVEVTKKLEDKSKQKKEYNAMIAFKSLYHHLMNTFSDDGKTLTRKQLTQAMAEDRMQKDLRHARVTSRDVFMIFDRLHGGLLKKAQDRVNADELLHCCLYYNQSLRIPDVVLLKLSSSAVARRCRQRSETLKRYSMEIQEGCEEISSFLRGDEKSKPTTPAEKMALALEPEHDEATMGSLQFFKHYTDVEAARLEQVELHALD